MAPAVAPHSQIAHTPVASSIFTADIIARERACSPERAVSRHRARHRLLGARRLTSARSPCSQSGRLLRSWGPGLSLFPLSQVMDRPDTEIVGFLLLLFYYLFIFTDQMQCTAAFYIWLFINV